MQPIIGDWITKLELQPIKEKTLSYQPRLPRIFPRSTSAARPYRLVLLVYFLDFLVKALVTDPGLISLYTLQQSLEMYFLAYLAT